MKSTNNVDKVLDNEMPVDPEATDAGEDTQSNYYFQNLCTSLIALRMYREQTEYDEIFCELYEDIVALKTNGCFVGIQIKHKKRGALLITSEAILKAIKRFIKHEKIYPAKFDKFIIVSNTMISIGDNKSINELSIYCQNRHDQKKPKMELVLSRICQKIDLSEEDVVKVLSKTESEKFPDIEYLVNEIANEHVANIQECRNKNSYQLKEIVNTIADIVHRKSTTIDDSLKGYFSFRENSQLKRNYAKIVHKRITKEEIKVIISKGEKISLLGSDVNWPKKIGSLDLIDKKMQLGGIHTSAIASMRNLAVNALNHFFRSQYMGESEGKNAELNDTTLKHVVGILDEQNAQAETAARLTGAPYGLRKLAILDQKVDDLSKNRSRDVLFLTPEILKGIIGLRMTECVVSFSDEPVEGFV